LDAATLNAATLDAASLDAATLDARRLDARPLDRSGEGRSHIFCLGGPSVPARHLDCFLAALAARLLLSLNFLKNCLIFFNICIESYIKIRAGLL
jgi:hypothetical protein